MQSTKNYQLVKQELTDVPDITQISGNWDKIDTEMKKLSDDKFDKSGGTVTGATTFEKGTITKGGATVDTLKVQGGTTTNTLTVTDDTKLKTVTVDDKLTVSVIRAKDGSESITIGINNPNNQNELLGLISQWVGGTNPRVSVTHHPEKASNDKSVATTYWVKSLIATQSEYGLVKLATEEDIVECDPQAVVHTPMMYEINDFRRVNTAYTLGEKVACAFEYEYFLECTKAGTTSGDLLDTRNVKFNQIFVDGTVEWTVRAHVRSINGAVADEHGNVSLEISNSWDDLQGKPSTFPPSSHSHAWGDITGKPSIPPNPKAYLVDSWRSGANWWRKWSDGFIEQGGLQGDTSTVTLHHNFSNTNYNIQLTFANKESTQAIDASGTKTTSSFTWHRYSGIGGYQAYWCACGF